MSLILTNAAPRTSDYDALIAAIDLRKAAYGWTSSTGGDAALQQVGTTIGCYQIVLGQSMSSNTDVRIKAVDSGTLNPDSLEASSAESATNLLAIPVRPLLRPAPDLMLGPSISLISSFQPFQIYNRRKHQTIMAPILSLTHRGRPNGKHNNQGKCRPNEDS